MFFLTNFFFSLFLLVTETEYFLLYLVSERNPVNIICIILNTTESVTFFKSTTLPSPDPDEGLRQGRRLRRHGPRGAPQQLQEP